MITGGVYYGGNSGRFCPGILMNNGSPAPVMSGVTGIGGQRFPDCHGIEINEGAAPELVNCTGRYKTYTQFLGRTGTASEQPIGDNYPFTKRDAPETVDSSSGISSVLLSIEIRIKSPVTNGTIDIGTTPSGDEIVSDIDASARRRVAPSFTTVTFSEDDQIYITPSDETITYNLRYQLAVDQLSAGLTLNSLASAVVSNCLFLSGTRHTAGEIGPKATRTKKYVITKSNLTPV